MPNYGFQTYPDMHLILGQIRGNGAAAVRLYAERCPQRSLPSPRTFHGIDKRTRETGTVRPSALDRDKRRNVRTVDVK
jgi:hypothetical protein